MWRVYLQIYWLPVDSFVVSCYSCSFILDLSLDILKFRKPAVWYVMELCPFWLCCYRGPCVWFGGIVIRGYVDQLEDKWSASDDAAAAGQKVPSYDVFEDRRLSRGLRSYNDLGVAVSRHPDSQNKILGQILQSVADLSYHCRLC